MINTTRRWFVQLNVQKILSDLNVLPQMSGGFLQHLQFEQTNVAYIDVFHNAAWSKQDGLRGVFSVENVGSYEGRLDNVRLATHGS